MSLIKKLGSVTVTEYLSTMSLATGPMANRGCVNDTPNPKLFERAVIVTFDLVRSSELTLSVSLYEKKKLPKFLSAICTFRLLSIMVAKLIDAPFDRFVVVALAMVGVKNKSTTVKAEAAAVVNTFWIPVISNPFPRIALLQIFSCRPIGSHRLVTVNRNAIFLINCQ